MKLEYTNEGIKIIPEDIRDELFMKQVLEIDKGKVFCKVSEYEGKWEATKCIEITVFDEAFKNHKYEEKRQGYKYQDNHHKRQ